MANIILKSLLVKYTLVDSILVYPNYWSFLLFIIFFNIKLWTFKQIIIKLNLKWRAVRLVKLTIILIIIPLFPRKFTITYKYNHWGEPLYGSDICL